MADIFDLCTFFGPVPPRGGDEGTDRLRALLTRHEISGAATLSTRALYHDVPRGNRETQEACAVGNGPRLVPVRVLDPRAQQETNGPEARLLGLFPATQGWPVRYAPLRALLESERPTPLLFEAARPGDATDAALVLREAGFSAPVVLVGVTGSVGLAEALAVAGGNPQIHLATNGLRGVGEIEAAVAALGAGRVVFASGTPRASLGAALATLRQAAVSEEDRARILGGNAGALLNGGTR